MGVGDADVPNDRELVKVADKVADCVADAVKVADVVIDAVRLAVTDGVHVTLGVGDALGSCSSQHAQVLTRAFTQQAR